MNAGIDVAHEKTASPDPDGTAGRARLHSAAARRALDRSAFRAGLAHRRAGRWDDARWSAFRRGYGILPLPAGPDGTARYAVRVRLPGGDLDPRAALALARVARRGDVARLSVTVRQDIQISGMVEADLADALADLDDAGLETRDTGGNRLRAIATCAFAGVCPEERFDAAALARRLDTAAAAHPLSRHWPRPFRAGVSGCARDCADARHEDLGFIARDGETLAVLAGGQSGRAARPAFVLVPAIGRDDAPIAVQAMAEVVHRQADRIGGRKPRVAESIDRAGLDRFRDDFIAAFGRLGGRLDHYGTVAIRPDAPPLPTAPAPRGIVVQKDGLAAMEIDLDAGEIGIETFDALARLADRFGAAGLRTTRRQSIVVLGVERDEIAALGDAVRALGLAIADPARGAVVTCVGRPQCRHGLVETRRLGAAVQQARAARGYGPLEIHISGCDRGCAREAVAPVGLTALDRAGTAAFRVSLDGNPIADIPAASAADVLARLDGLVVPGAAVLRAALDGAALPQRTETAPSDPAVTETADARDQRLKVLTEAALRAADTALARGNSDDALASARDAALFAARRLLPDDTWPDDARPRDERPGDGRNAAGGADPFHRARALIDGDRTLSRAYRPLAGEMSDDAADALGFREAAFYWAATVDRWKEQS